MSMDLLIKKIKEKGNPSIVGLDPKLDYVPDFIIEKNFAEYGANLEGAANAILDYNKALIDSLYDVMPAVKPQSAYYEMYGIYGEKTLYETIQYAKSKGIYVLLDGKRNDIGATSEAYSTAYLGETKITEEKNLPAFGADGLTVNGYLGSDGIIPFTDNCKKFGKTIFVLVKTSNKSGIELQDMELKDGRKVYERMAELVNEWGADTVGEYGYTSVGAVVGATYPEEAKALRQIMKNVYFLVPGYGAQGGSAKDVQYSFNDDGLGAIVNSSRGIMCAYKKGAYRDEEFAIAAREEAIRMREEIVSFIR